MITSPYGNIARPLNPTTLALAYGATFVARTFSKERDKVEQVITQAIQHKRFSFVHDLSPCVEFNKLVTYKSIHDKIIAMSEDYTADNRTRAMLMSESTDPIFLGLYFKEDILTFDQNVLQVKDSFKS